MKTHQLIKVDCQSIIPTVFNFNKRYYEYDRERIEYINDNQFVLVNNTVYDENLRPIAEYDPNYFLLDTLGHFVATISKKNKIHLFLAQPGKSKSFFKECNYFCYVRDSEKRIELVIDTSAFDSLDFVFNDYFGYISFDPISKKYRVNEQLIKQEKADRTIHDYEVIDNYNIWDALEGDTEAYWNIE